MCWHILGLNNGLQWLSPIKYLESVINTFNSFLFIGVFLDYLEFSYNFHYYLIFVSLNTSLLDYIYLYILTVCLPPPDVNSLRVGVLLILFSF